MLVSLVIVPGSMTDSNDIYDGKELDFQYTFSIIYNITKFGAA